MMWAIKHKSGRVLFVTGSKATADNREKMGWIVDKIISKCPKCNDTGMADSGGVHPWGEPILIECDCMLEELKMTSREQFEEWVTKETGFDLWRTEFPMTEWDYQQYKCHQTNLAWMAWQASRAAIENGSIVAYQDFYGNAISAADFDGGEDEMHETAFNEQWTPLIKADGLKVKV